jgi:hypothetical protein
MVLFAAQLPLDIGIEPFPGPALKIKLPIEVRFPGEYRVVLTMPKVGEALGLTSETIPCDFSVSVADERSVIHSLHIERITRFSEMGFANTQQYADEQAFHLPRGRYVATIIGGDQCSAARERGAMVTFERQERDNILAWLLLEALTGALFVGGVGGLLYYGFRRRPRTLVGNDGSP